MADDEIGAGLVLVSEEDRVRSVTAFFDSPAEAERAEADLLAAGIASRLVSTIAQGTSSFDPAEGEAPAGGFWETFKDMFMPAADRDQFAEGVRRGGATLVVRTDNANHDRVVAILDRDGAVDLDEREEYWRQERPLLDPLAEARTPALSIAADEEDMGYQPASAATAGFAASGAHLAILDDPTGAPPVESPGALPPSALDGAAAPSEGPRREPHLGSSRVRSYGVATSRPPGIDPGI